MKNKTIIGILAAIILIAAVIYLVASIGGPDTHVIVMPSPTAENGGNTVTDGGGKLDITPETLKTALETVNRTQSFSRAYSVKTYWEGGESEEIIKHWSRDGKTRLVISQDTEVKNILILDDRVYIWYDGDQRAMEAGLSEASVKRETDRLSRLLTYEDIYALDQDDILDAGYGEKFGHSCIYAKYKQGIFDYVNQIYLSIDSGLLISIEVYDGEKLVNSMELIAAVSSVPEEDLFQLPF